MFIEILVGLAIAGVASVFGSDSSPSASAAQTKASPEKAGERNVTLVKVNRPAPPGKPAAIKPATISAPSSTSGFQLTEEMKKALTLMEKTNENVYISGGAGTGKSTLLALFMANTRKSVVALAPTGIAALNISGQTIHSFFRFPLRPLEEDGSGIKAMRNRQTFFRQLDQIIIDEVSMVRADLFEAIDRSLRINRNSSDPFGGVQIIIIGDPFQLPPVVRGELEDYFDRRFGGPYFFNANCFREGKFHEISLTRCFRQSERSFLEALNNIRVNSTSYNDLALLNARAETPRESAGDAFITLCATNNGARAINEEHMKGLRSREFVFRAVIEGRVDKDLPAEEILSVKEGAQIMMLKNRQDRAWRNGSLGYISKLSQNTVEVEIDGKTHSVSPETWEICEYKYDPETRKLKTEVVGKFTQYPLKLAWAITIHKSQGQTFNRAHIDLGRGAFNHGQTYVALSRARSLAGLTLAREIRPGDIIVDQRVIDFARRLQAPSLP